MEIAAKRSMLPLTAKVNSRGHLVIGGCDTVQLAAEFGTPLYIFDESGLRARCRELITEFTRRYADTIVIYACKAFINRAFVQIMIEEGLGLDVVSAGELGIAQSAGFPLDRVYFHGNNKSAEEIRLTLKWHIGRIVVDNLYELNLLNTIAREMDYIPDILLRLSPGIDPHTHKYIATGFIDSKFGIPLSIGEDAVTAAMSSSYVNLVGLHFHIGSLIPETEPYEKSAERILGFAAEMKRKHGFELKELNTGGGFAVQYTQGSPVPDISIYAEALTSVIKARCHESGMALPRLIIEPGRSVVARAGVALYKVGAVKDIPGVRRYVSVDGGMGDNIRHALYGAKHEAVVSNKMREKEEEKVTISGKFCESGDILIRDIDLPPVTAGDIIAILESGAYCLPMASNYNASMRPAVVLVRDGKARLIRRRETLEDLTRCDLV